MNNKVAIAMYLSIITLNVHGLNAPIKRHRVTEWIRRQDPNVRCPPETRFGSNGTPQTESQGKEKDTSCKWK